MYQMSTNLYICNICKNFDFMAQRLSKIFGDHRGAAWRCLADAAILPLCMDLHPAFVFHNKWETMLML